jgi:rod shape-determining protein MreD
MKDPKAAVLIFLLLFIALIIQSTIFEFLKVFNIRPDLCLLIIVFVSLKRGPMAGMFTGFTGGIMEGFFTPPYGFYALIKTILGYVLGRFEGILSIDPFFMRILLVAGATAAKGILSGFAHLIFGIAAPAFFTYLAGVLIEILYNSLLAPFIFLLLNKLKIFKAKNMEIM